MKYKITKNQLRVIENLNLKSRGKEQEKDAIEFYSEKINNNEEVLEIGYDVFQKLSQDVKNRFWFNYLKLWSDTDWDFNYEVSQNDPFKTMIKNLLVESLKDEEILLKIADNFYWSDGSNGYISFDNLNHFITDLGYRIFAEYPQIIRDKNLEEFKKQLLRNGSVNVTPFIRERFKDFKYNPNDEFSW
jgi:hypothetical protein